MLAGLSAKGYKMDDYVKPVDLSSDDALASDDALGFKVRVALGLPHTDGGAVIVREFLGILRQAVVFKAAVGEFTVADGGRGFGARRTLDDYAVVRLMPRRANMACAEVRTVVESVTSVWHFTWEAGAVVAYLDGRRVPPDSDGSNQLELMRGAVEDALTGVRPQPGQDEAG